MSAPPDALALFRTVLANPADDVPRLVFADWLEDTGEPHNAAWAEYLRLNTQAQGRDTDPLHVADCGWNVRARLGLSAAVFVGNEAVIQKLLPARNVRVRLAAFQPWLAVAELVPLSVALENLVVPLSLVGNTLYMATPTPVDEALLLRIAFILNRDIVFTRADAAEIRDCLLRTYGEPPTESVDSILVEFPELILHPDRTR